MISTGRPFTLRPFFCQPGSGALIASLVLLFHAVSAWATLAVVPPFSPDSLQASHSGAARSIVVAPFLLQEQEDDELVRSAKSAPDVLVFPIHVAGPVVAERQLSNKLALETGAGAIAVLYPEIAEPYRSVFTQIIDGIEARAKGHVASFALGPNVKPEDLKNDLRRRDTRVVIALGRQGMKAAAVLDGGISVVVGGVLSVSESEAREAKVNSLSPDPALLFSRLKNMAPGVRRIYTVYDPRQNAWMMRLAKDAARTLGMELVAREAQDLRGAMQIYQEILDRANSDTDALWLPQDSTTVDEGSVLPMVLQESWKRNLAVFSSSFGHVKRGVLFSLYPNNVELGRRLAGSALDLASSGGSGSGILPLREVLMAVNVRTAKHLEIDIGRQQKFDMAFPEQ